MGYQSKDWMRGEIEIHETTSRANQLSLENDAMLGCINELKDRLILPFLQRITGQIQGYIIYSQVIETPLLLRAVATLSSTGRAGAVCS